MGTVKDGNRFAGVAAQGRVAAGLAQAGKVFFRAPSTEQPTGEIWYVDAVYGTLTQTKPSSANIWLGASDDFELFCFWFWSSLLHTTYQDGMLNSFEIPARYVERIADGLFFEFGNGTWIDVSSGTWHIQADSDLTKATLVIDTRNGEPRNGDIWLEVER